MCDVVKSWSCKSKSFTWNLVTQTFSQTGDNDSCVSSRHTPSTEKCEGEKLLQMINIYKCAYVMFALFVVLRRFLHAYSNIQKKKPSHSTGYHFTSAGKRLHLRKCNKIIEQSNKIEIKTMSERIFVREIIMKVARLVSRPGKSIFVLVQMFKIREL